MKCDVTVIVATYRRNQELSRALKSLAQQEFDDFEILVVDDNDDPNWNELVKAAVSDVATAYPHLSITHIENHPNLGSAQARNIGIAAAHGKYITFLDDDDLYLPEKIAVQYQFMESNKLDYSLTDLDLYREDDCLLEQRNRSYVEKVDPDSLFRYHMMHHLTGTDTMMFTKEYLDRIEGFAPIDVGDEFYLMERAILAGGRFGHLPRCDVKAYIHYGEGGLSSGQQKVLGENNLFEYKKQYFHRFDKKCVRFIKMRHYAVLAYAYLRMRKFGVAMKEAMHAFLCSPIGCVKLFLNR